MTNTNENSYSVEMIEIPVKQFKQLLKVSTQNLYNLLKKLEDVKNEIEVILKED